MTPSWQNDFTDEEMRALEAWPTLPPDADVAARVLAEVEARRRRVQRRSALAVAALVFVVAGAAVYWNALQVPPARGSLLATERTTVPLGGRAVAVAEQGTALRWYVPSAGQARIEQTSGDTFYRVDPGDELRVSTPLGDVRVLGTCFRVEVITMKQGIIGALAGAAASAALLVTVYEGRVVVAGDGAGNALEVAAGDKVRVTPGGKPTKVVRSRESVAFTQARAAVAAAVTERKQTPGFIEVPEDSYANLLEASDALQERVEELEKRLSVEEEMRRTREGVALAPPPDLDERYSEGHLLSAFENAISQGDIPVEVTAVDCTEYPCIIFGEAVGERGQEWAAGRVNFMRELLGQPAFAEYEEDADKNVSVWRTVDDEDDSPPTTAFGVSFYPKSDQETRGEEIKHRVGHRVGEILDPKNP